MSTLTELYYEIARCQDCDLAKHRTHVVPGEGSENAKLLFIGEAPGWYEDQAGRPFVGAAGEFLNHLLSLIGLSREDIYIANILKCRPPGNRDPLPQEIQSCQKWLDRQIEIIQPKMIVTLGRYSLARYFPQESIGKIHGKERRLNNLIVYPMYHPAAALHRGGLRQVIEADMRRIPQVLAQSEKFNEPSIEVQQLSLF
jgi:DNA polymerase